AAAQVHAADLRAIHAVAGRALRGVDLGAVADVGRSIRDSAILTSSNGSPRRAQEQHHAAYRWPRPPPPSEQVQALRRSEHRFTRIAVLILSGWKQYTHSRR